MGSIAPIHSMGKIVSIQMDWIPARQRRICDFRRNDGQDAGMAVEAMATREELKQAACAAIDRRREDLIAVSRDILEHPEPGYSEYRTARVVAEQFAKLGIKFRAGLALTGLKGEVKGGAGAGPRVAIIGELDSLIVNGHPHAAADTSAAHACGHHCQIGMMLGAVLGLSQPEVLSELSGDIVPFAVPAEEFIEVARRLELRESGKIEFMGGKQELIQLGEFDDVDIAMMCHTASDMGAYSLRHGRNQQRSRGEVRSVHRPRRPRRLRAASGHQRAERRQLRIAGHQCQSGAVPGTGYGTHPWDHDQGGRSGQCGAGGRASGMAGAVGNPGGGGA